MLLFLLLPPAVCLPMLNSLVLPFRGPFPLFHTNIECPLLCCALESPSSPSSLTASSSVTPTLPACYPLLPSPRACCYILNFFFFTSPLFSVPFRGVGFARGHVQIFPVFWKDTQSLDMTVRKPCTFLPPWGGVSTVLLSTPMLGAGACAVAH